MPNLFGRPFKVPVPKKSAAEAEEFGPGKKGLLLCKGCGAVYFKKHWHENLEALNKAEEVSFEKGAPTKPAICPACSLIGGHQYEGRVTIKNVPAKDANELEGVIRNFAAYLEDRDPMDRLIEIKKSGGDWLITFTENQAANKLAKKIADVFPAASFRARFAPEPSDVAEATVEFSE